MRAVLIVLSLAAAGFLAVQERGARAAAAIERTALAPTGTPAPPQVEAARARLKTAQRWNPDTDPAVNLGVLEVRARQFRTAAATFATVTRREPENAQAWSLLSFAAAGYDSGLAATARARARALEPPVPAAR